MYSLFKYNITENTVKGYIQYIKPCNLIQNSTFTNSILKNLKFNPIQYVKHKASFNLSS